MWKSERYVVLIERYYITHNQERTINLLLIIDGDSLIPPRSQIFLLIRVFEEKCDWSKSESNIYTSNEKELKFALMLMKIYIR